MPRKLTNALAALVALATLFGCRSHSSPYDYAENWLIREDPIRPFVFYSDVIYVQGYLYNNAADVPLMFSYAKAEVGNKRFTGIARVFAPLIATPEDFENAMNWYFRYHHESKRPFFFIGEGEGGKIMRAYEQENESSLKSDGLIASYYTDSQHKGFVTDELVSEIKNALAKVRFRNIWGRDLPETGRAAAPQSDSRQKPAKEPAK